jgi:histidinol-phosphate aminotransferase
MPSLPPPWISMAAAAPGAGLIFVCNPNNPTGCVHTKSDIASFVEKVRRTAPDAVIHLDEAYHEYVTHPDYESAVALAVETPNVVVTRTFSKCFGMAGMRVGYAIAHRDTMANVSRYSLGFNTNTAAVAGAVAALEMKGFIAQERERNAVAKKYTVDFFKGLGMEVLDSQTNFIFANIGRPASEFRSACRSQRISVGRDFPPMHQTHCRISIGTMEEMQRACKVFKEVLA